jgi:hypothetical protein
MYFLDKTRSLFLNDLEFIPVTENLIYFGCLLQRYDDNEGSARKHSVNVRDNPKF